jgi:hypothetical protein
MSESLTDYLLLLAQESYRELKLAVRYHVGQF